MASASDKAVRKSTLLDACYLNFNNTGCISLSSMCITCTQHKVAVQGRLSHSTVLLSAN